MVNTTESEATRELLPCSFKFHEFHAKISDITINCHIIKMEDCLYLWVGDGTSNKMEDLSFALISSHGSDAIATKIMGGVSDTTSMSIARRLTMKLGKPVYVSFNVTTNNMLLSSIEKRIQEEFKKSPDLLSF